MITTYATFDPAQLGTGIASEMSGTVISVDTNNALNQYSRATLGKDELSWYAEFIVYGSASIANATSIGLVNASATGYVGSDANGWGYLLDEGEIRNNGSDISGSGGVPQGAKGDVVSVSLVAQNDSAGTMTATWALNGVPIHSEDLAADTYYLAVTLAVPSGSDTLRCFMNCGQRAFDYSDALGWYDIPTDLPALRIATHDYIAPSTAPIPNTPFDAVIPDRTRFTIARKISFWPDGEAATRSSAGKVKVINTHEGYDWLLESDFEQLDATVKVVEDGVETTLSAMQVVGADGKSDSIMALSFSDKIQALERPLQTALIHPDATEANANRPWPIIIGAARSLSPVLVDEAGLRYAISDRPVVGLGYVRDKGDPYNPNAVPPDYVLSNDRRFMIIDAGAAPQGKVTADLSSVGGGADPTSADDAWDGYGNPFADDSSGNPAGFTSVGGGGEEVDGIGHLVLASDASTTKTLGVSRGTWLPGRSYRLRIKYQFRIDNDLNPWYQDYSHLMLSNNDNYFTAIWHAHSRDNVGIQELEKTITIDGSYPANMPIELRMYSEWGNGSNIKCTVYYCEILLIPDTYTPAAIDPANLETFTAEVLENRAGLQPSQWDRDSARAIDTDSSYTGIGFFASDEISVRDAIQTAMSSYTACMFQGSDGKIKFQRLTAPEDETAAYSVDMSDMLTDLVKTMDRALGLSTRMGYRRNWTILNDTDFVTDFIDVPRDVRRALSHKHQGIAASAVQLPAMYRDAVQADPIGTLLDSADDAQTEIDRICNIYADPRAYYTVTIAQPEFHVGDVVELTYYRYGLESGRNLLVKEMVYDVIKDTAKVTFWGLA